MVSGSYQFLKCSSWVVKKKISKGKATNITQKELTQAGSQKSAKVQKAIKDFERALKIDPTNQNAFQYLSKIKDNVQKRTPNTVILPMEAVETRKPEWRVIPSNVKVSSTARDVITMLGSSSSSSGHNIHDKNSAHVTTVNGYAFEREDSDSNNSSGSDGINDSTAKKRKRDKEGKVKKSRREDKKKKHKHKDNKKSRKK